MTEAKVVVELSIEQIKTGTNVRDLGDLSELKASIKEKGVLEPLIVNLDHTLIAGARRLQSVKELLAEGVTKCTCGRPLNPVPIVVLGMSAEEATEVQLTENLMRKDMTPLEEAKAFNDYLSRTKRKSDFLAAKIGKQTRYVENRVTLLKLCPDAQKAVLDRSLPLEHARVLSQLKNDEQKAMLHAIKTHTTTLQELRDMLAFTDLDFEGLAPIMRQDRSGNKTLLSSVGRELDAESGSREVQNLLKSRLAQYLEKERAKLRAQKIKVWADPNDVRKEYKSAIQVSEYSYGNALPIKFEEAIKQLPGSDLFGVVVYWNGYLHKDVFCLKPKELAKAKETTKKKGSAASEERDEESMKRLELSHEQQLARKVQEYKHSWMNAQARALVKPGKVAKAMTVYVLADHISSGWGSGSKRPDAYGAAALKELAIAQGVLDKDVSDEEFDEGPYELDLEPLLKLSEEKLDDLIYKLGLSYAHQYETEWAETAAKAAGLKIEKAFVLDKAYLEMHTKEQLAKLAREFKLPKDTLEGIEKKDGVMTAILGAWKKGSVPKAFEKA